MNILLHVFEMNDAEQAEAWKLLCRSMSMGESTVDIGPQRENVTEEQRNRTPTKKERENCLLGGVSMEWLLVTTDGSVFVTPSNSGCDCEQPYLMVGYFYNQGG